VPAAAVIPAPIAYTNAVAVKKLVVGFRFDSCREALCFWLVAWCERLHCRLHQVRVVALWIQPSAFGYQPSDTGLMPSGSLLHWMVEALPRKTCVELGTRKGADWVARRCYCEQNSVSKAADLFG